MIHGLVFICGGLFGAIMMAVIAGGTRHDK